MQSFRPLQEVIEGLWLELKSEPCGYCVNVVSQGRGETVFLFSNGPLAILHAERGEMVRRGFPGSETVVSDFISAGLAS